ncbi:hypothetical protein NQ317_019296 [Molorchus minor]|uniref:Gustatory receptor n=1 Tax=Molorchus minor TaxID=1323400 RepID=A0ABQ9J8A0_9CUCU|nr:hypothetical protein NQ317_019296 [Molorchus minor]
MLVPVGALALGIVVFNSDFCESFAFRRAYINDRMTVVWVLTQLPLDRCRLAMPSQTAASDRFRGHSHGHRLVQYSSWVLQPYAALMRTNKFETAYGPLTIMFACDLTVKASEELLRTCYDVEKYMPMDSKEGRHLKRLQNLIKNNVPAFTAAGFFKLNRSTLLYLISTITTVLIVYVQL